MMRAKIICLSPSTTHSMMNKPFILYEDCNNTYQALEIPSHHRTIVDIDNNIHRVMIPDSIAVFCKEGNYFDGLMVSRNLDHYINFGSGLCSDMKMHDVFDVINWIWNSKFKCVQDHTNVPLTHFVECYGCFYHLAIKYNPKIIARFHMSEIYKYHLKICNICNSWKLYRL